MHAVHVEVGVGGTRETEGEPTRLGSHVEAEVVLLIGPHDAPAVELSVIEEGGVDAAAGKARPVEGDALEGFSALLVGLPHFPNVADKVWTRFEHGFSGQPTGGRRFRAA